MAHNPLYSNPNGFPMANGYTLHMDLTSGDLANRLVTVGSPARAKMLAGYLDELPKVKEFHSNRGFSCYTGCYNGVPVSIVAIGMGVPMMDFFVREAKAIIEGPMAIVRFGTCGGAAPDAPQGMIAVASKGSGYITRNPNAFKDLYFNPTAGRNDISPYDFHAVAPADEEFSALVTKLIGDAVGADKVIEGVNVTADSFYSTQARIDDRFHDYNEDLLKQIHEHYPEAKSMEMETFQLFHLAKCCTTPIKTAAAAIILANRYTCKVIETDVEHQLERLGGRAVIDAVSRIAL